MLRATTYSVQELILVLRPVLVEAVSPVVSGPAHVGEPHLVVEEAADSRKPLQPVHDALLHVDQDSTRSQLPDNGLFPALVQVVLVWGSFAKKELMASSYARVEDVEVILLWFGDERCSPSASSQNLHPIWFPHCPTWIVTISRGIVPSRLSPSHQQSSALLRGHRASPSAPLHSSRGCRTA